MGRRLRRDGFRIAALGLVAAVSVANVVRMMVEAVPPPVAAAGTSGDAVIRAEERFSPLKATISTRARDEPIGYLAQLPRSQWRVNSRSVEDYYLAQFSLVPLILDPDDDRHGWMVADLPMALLPARVPPGWTVVEGRDNGPFLLRKGSR